MSSQRDSQPVIIGVAQETWRDRDSARTPVDALQAVAAKALSDTGSDRVISAIDAVVHVPFIMTQEPALRDGVPRNAGTAAAQRLGVQAPVYSAEVGGNLPQSLVNVFAGRLERGECRAVLLFGAELLATFLGAVRSGAGFPDWSTGRDDDPIDLGMPFGNVSDVERAHGLWEPVHTYPLFESALRHARGLSVDAHAQQLARLIVAMSRVSQGNPYAWKRPQLTVESVLATEDGNRMISTPYTKIMNSVIAVDQAAALVLTTVGEARALGIDTEQLVYLRGGADASDTASVLERESLHRSAVLARAAETALASSALTLEELDFFDLYSCFPSAIQIAADALGLAIDDPRGVTVTGGMMLFGGPGNNYSTHAIAEMVERLRARGDASGLVTANGGYLTKQSVGIYSTRPGPAGHRPDAAAPGAADNSAAARPRVAVEADGPLVLEAHTVRYRSGERFEGMLIGRTEDGSRCVAVSQHGATLERLEREDCVGVAGYVEHREGQNHFRF